MSILWIVLALPALAVWLGWLARVVREDGLGHREPPRSHLGDEGGTPVTHVFSR